MTEKIPAAVATFSIFLVTLLSVLALCLPQIELDVQPDRTRFPDLHCDVTLYFYNRHTECPHRPSMNYRTPRDEGLFNCIQAYDNFQTALAFTAMGCILSGLGIFAQIGTFFNFTQRVATVISFIAVVCFTIAWPLSWSQTTNRHCGHYLKDAVNDAGQQGYDAYRGTGLNLLVASWVFSIFNLLISVCVLNNDAFARTFAFATKSSSESS